MSGFSVMEVASIVRVLQDTIRTNAGVRIGCDAVYAVAEAPDNAFMTLVTARELHKPISGSDIRIPVAIAGWDTDKFGYPGYRSYRQGLIDLGIHEEDIIVIPPLDLEHGNTRTEALAFAKYAHEAGWKSVAVVAPTVHQPRAFLTILKAVLEKNLKICLHNVIAPQSWNRTVTHNQGVVSGRMDELLEGEISRILAYSINGHVALGKEVFEYLRWRDGSE